MNFKYNSELLLACIDEDERQVREHISNIPNSQFKVSFFLF